MTYSFVSGSDAKFAKISDQEFTADETLLKQVDLTSELEHRAMVPVGVAIIPAADTQRLPNAFGDLTAEPLAVMPGQRLVYDLGALHVGHFAVAIDAAGSPMDAPFLFHIRFAETLPELAENASQVDSWLPLSWIQDERCQIELLPHMQVFGRRYSCRYISIEPIGQSRKWHPVFSKPVFTAESAVLSRRVAPLMQLPKWLRVIDDKCVETLRNTTQFIFEDGTKRDRRLWLSDFRTQALVNYATFGDVETARRCLFLFGSFSDADGRMPADIFTRFPVPVADDLFWFDYELLFPVALAEYVRATNDVETLRQLYPVAKRAMTYLGSQLHDLVVGPRSDVFVDWSSHADKEAAVQAEFIMALQQFTTLAKRMADSDAATYDTWLAQLMIKTRAHYYDETQHAFVSGVNREVNPLSQIYMLLADILPASETNLVIERLLQFNLKREVTTPNTQGLLAEALFKHGRTNEALQIIRMYWQGMVDRGADTFWEVYDEENTKYSPYGSILLNGYCFGWSCYPAYLLRKYL